MINGVAAVYADGGLLYSNPSKLGGTWAYRLIDHWDLPIAQSSGFVAWGGDRDGVTNNQMEVQAIVSGLEQLPDAWSGNVYSDSIIALKVIIGTMRPRWLYGPLAERTKEVRYRLGTLSACWLKGHPRKADAKRGKMKNGAPCSIHQVWCDQECRRVAHEVLRGDPALARLYRETRKQHQAASRGSV